MRGETLEFISHVKHQVFIRNTSYVLALQDKQCSQSGHKRIIIPSFWQSNTNNKKYYWS